MLHTWLEFSCAPVFFITQGAVNCLIETAGGEIRLNSRIKSIRVVLIEPRMKFLNLSGRKFRDRALNLFDGIRSHSSLL